MLLVTPGLDGSSTIRVFRQEETFTQRFFGTVDQNSSALLNFVSSQRWLGLRIELLGSLVVLVASVLVISLNNVWKIDPGLGKWSIRTRLVAIIERTTHVAYS